MMQVSDKTGNGFITTVEVVPPEGQDAGPVLSELKALSPLAFDGFSVATNPVATSRLCAMALCSLIQNQTDRPAVLHCTTRDHNRLSLQSTLWGAKALGIETVMVATGDRVAFADRGITTTVGDVDVYELIAMARESGLFTGVVLDPRSESNELEVQVRRLERKVRAGAQFAVTQPVYDEAAVQALAEATKKIGIPVILGILPLRTPRHAEFLHREVAGITVPDHVRDRMADAADPVVEGVANACEILAIARDTFAGACIMPPFDHYEVLFDILGNNKK